MRQMLEGLGDTALRYWIEVIFGAIVAGLGYLYRKTACRVQEQREAQGALRAGTLALLRSEIIRNYDHYKAKGTTPIYAMENVLELYEAYHALGGNGTITKLVDELRDQSSK